MAKITINNVELEADISEVETAQNFQNELKKIENIKDKLVGKDMVESLKIQCKAVFDFVDTIFGEDTHKKLFGDRISLKECISVFAEIVQKLTADLETIGNVSQTTNRKARRKTKK